MQTSNHLPYTVTYDFKEAQRYMRGYSRYANFMQRWAHRRARQAIKKYLHHVLFNKTHREPQNGKWITGWEID